MGVQAVAAEPMPLTGKHVMQRRMMQAMTPKLPASGPQRASLVPPLEGLINTNRDGAGDSLGTPAARGFDQTPSDFDQIPTGMVPAGGC